MDNDFGDQVPVGPSAFRLLFTIIPILYAHKSGLVPAGVRVRLVPAGG